MASKRKATAEPATQTVDITPTPRILRMLGEIDFEPWQCIAELVDNGFDEFLRIKRSGEAWTEPFELSVSLPSQDAPTEESAIVVRDNGRGMTLGEVTDAVRAGWTTNDPLAHLGLFGMGFNIATARLGRSTRILTTRSGEAEWVGIGIDLERIPPGFAAPVIREPKSSRGEHGTRVEVSSLYQRADWLKRAGNQRKLRETLGGVYSYLLEQEGFQLTVKDVGVKPIGHCAWDRSRTVTRGREEIPAVIEIDKPLADRAVCLHCAAWQDPGNDVCELCASDQLDVRERRIWGWVGIQRYLDTSDFGIDFLRNGRKILRFDRTLFEWANPDDPSDRIPEYPIDLPHQGGRIVGEIHIDHVPVNYTKDNFERSDRSWRDTVRAVRGDGPLLPEKATERGYSRNDSPLGRLHRGFRRGDAGRSYLVPGDGAAPIHETTREWGRRFRAGDADYQSDAKWWEAVLYHEKQKAKKKREKEARERAEAERDEEPAAEFRDETTPAPDEEPAPSDGATEEPLTERERLEALLQAATAIPELGGQFTATGVAGRPLKMTAYEVASSPVRTADGKRVPVLFVGQGRDTYAAFVDVGHSHFARFDDDAADVVLMELAAHLIARAQGDAPPISAVFADLKGRYLGDRAIEVGDLAALAIQRMRDLKERMATCVVKEQNPERPWRNALNDHERTITSDRLATMANVTDIDASVLDGSYLKYVPDTVVPPIVEEWPEAFFDDRLFRAPYRDVEHPPAKRQIVARVTGYLNDLAWLAQTPDDTSRDRLIRARLSLQLLPDDLADEG